jgi:LysM repeat protein
VKLCISSDNGWTSRAAPAKAFLLLALVIFVLAAVFGLATNMPLRYEEPTPGGLAKLLNSRYWDASATKGQIRVAEAQVNTLSVGRATNDKKVNRLVWAIRFELAAVACLAVAIGFILYEGVPAQKQPSPSPSPTRAYTVQPGDSLWDISERLLGPKATAQKIDQAWRIIYRDNHSTIGADPNRIFPGEMLRIPIPLEAALMGTQRTARRSAPD